MGRSGINMKNLMAVAAIPLRRRQLHNVITYSDHQVSLFQNQIGIIFLGNSDGPHRVRIFIGDNSFRHHGIDHRNFQLLGKYGQCF